MLAVGFVTNTRQSVNCREMVKFWQTLCDSLHVRNSKIIGTRCAYEKQTMASALLNTEQH